MKNKKIYTNGTYEVYGYMKGFWRWRKLHGYITKTKHPNVYNLGDKVNFKKYHLFWDLEPQFKLVTEKS